MKAELAKRELDILALWEKEGLYHKIQQARAGAPEFILHDGPPYANGAIHVGHAVNKVLKDIIIKAKVLSGFAAPYVPGWDCHGLPIELVVEKKYGKVGHKLDAAEFRQKCREYAYTQIETQRADFKRLGILGDWEAPYATMDHRYEAEQIRVLAKVYLQGHIKKGYKPVHWCLDCGSSLAEAEVEYKDKVSDSIYVCFPSEKGQVLIWTTTPWTLPANQAVAAGPDIIYAQVRVEGEIYVVAQALLEAVFGAQTIDILATFTGQDLEHLTLKHPFEDRTVPLILGDHVTTDAGTGFVHTAPAHGVDDFIVCQKNDIPVRHTVGQNGCYLENVPHFAGLHVSKVNATVMALLEEKGHLLRAAKITHSFPHCWRHKTPLIFRATPQWFISMEHLLGPAVAVAETVQFIPEEGRNRFMSMLKGRPDWCISRQRTWGVPIAFFTHKETGALHPDTPALLAEVASRIEKNGLEAWFGATPQDFGVDAACYDKAMDIMDVWFDSGASNQCVLHHHPALHFPADLYLEGSDQHRAWFQSSLLTAVAAEGHKPFAQILTHGFTVDGEGRKMSKSIGNIVTPQEVIQQYGADVLRLWVALSDYRGEMTISAAILKQTADLYRKIRNTFRYMLAALEGFEAKQALPVAGWIEIDQFMLAKTDALQSLVQSALQLEGQYNIRAAITAIHDFCEDDLSNVYFDVLKDRLYTENDSNRHSAQSALRLILNRLVRMVAPVLSFTAEEAWQLMRTKGWTEGEDLSVFTTQFLAPTLMPAHVEAWQEHWPLLKNIRAEVNKTLDEMRKEKRLGGNLEANVAYPLPVDQTFFQKLAASGELKYFFITSDFEVAPTLKIEVSHASKCCRCWHHSPSVQVRIDLINDPTQAICDRCYANVKNQGVKRRYF